MLRAGLGWGKTTRWAIYYAKALNQIVHITVPSVLLAAELHRDLKAAALTIDQ